MTTSTGSKKITALISLGAALEYYDFIIYGMMSTYLGTLFFPQDDPFVSSLMAFATFSIGYLARPLGGMLFGILADRKGRKSILLIQTSLVAFSTFAIGLVPTYVSIGFTASILLVFLRILQGMSFGAELPGAITILKESFNKAGLPFSFIVSSTGMGATLASLSLYLLSHKFTHQEVLDFAWRIPFLLGGVLAFLTLIMRRYLNETPEFIRYKEQNKQKTIRLGEIFKKSYKELSMGALLCIFSSCLVIMNIFFPSYISTYYGYPLSTIYWAIAVSLVSGAIYAPLLGYLSDRTNKTYIIIFASFSFICLTPFFYSLLTSQHTYNLVLFLILYQFIISTIQTCLFPLLAQLFQTSTRFTSIAICYNFTYSGMTLSTALVSYILHVFGSPFLLFMFCIFCSFFTLSACFLLNRSLAQNKIGLDPKYA